MNTISHSISRDTLKESMDYQTFNDLVNLRLDEGRTTNDDNSESMLRYTMLNLRRTERWDKRAQLSEELLAELSDIPFHMSWLVITEGWCGDSSQLLPFFHKMAEAAPEADLKIILRDDHPEIMDEFLTNGSRSIPKLIALNTETLEVVGTWGPRPGIVQDQYMAEREDPEIENKKASENLHLWYARDKGNALQEEFVLLLREWKEEVLAD